MPEEKGLALFLYTYIRMFFLLAPFFGVSMFLKMSEGLDKKDKSKAALRSAIAVLTAIFIFFFFGKPLFYMLGITLAAFQIGAGSILFISSALLVLGISTRSKYTPENDDDFSIVPLGLPIIVGPGTIGTLMVWGTQITDSSGRVISCVALFASAVTVYIMLSLAEPINKLLGKKILSIIIKITALILVALAAQIIFTGIKAFLQ